MKTFCTDSLQETHLFPCTQARVKSARVVATTTKIVIRCIGFVMMICMNLLCDREDERYKGFNFKRISDTTAASM